MDKMSENSFEETVIMSKNNLEETVKIRDNNIEESYIIICIISHFLFKSKSNTALL